MLSYSVDINTTFLQKELTVLYPLLSN